MGINTCYYFFGSFAVSHHYIAPFFFFLLFNQLGTFLICLPLPNPVPPPQNDISAWLSWCDGYLRSTQGYIRSRGNADNTPDQQLKTIKLSLIWRKHINN